MKNTVPVGISARHVFLSQDHIDFLFGDGYELTNVKELTQPGLFSADETVDIRSDTGETIEKVRIVGPAVPRTIVVISQSDVVRYHLEAPVRVLDDIDYSGSCYIVGPKGELRISEGVIIQQRHIHFSLDDAKEYGVENGQIVKIKVNGVKGGIMDNVVCFVGFNQKLDFHVDIDDADAFLLNQGDIVEIIK